MGTMMQNLQIKSAEFVERPARVGKNEDEMREKLLLSWMLVLAGVSILPVHGARRPPSSTPPPAVVTTTTDRPVISAL